MSIVYTALGGVLVVVVARDLFHQIFHPAGKGFVSQTVLRATFRGLRAVSRRMPKAFNVSGPLGLLLSILAWGTLLTVGFALIFMPQMPEQFRLASGLAPAGQGSFGDALYLSLVTLATLGYGDISPTSLWLRVLAPVEALLGFALLTASLSWVLSLYPVLGRRRALAYNVSALTARDCAFFRQLLVADPSAAATLLNQLSSQVAQFRADFVQFPTAQFFHAPDSSGAVTTALMEMKELSRIASESGAGPAAAGAILDASLESAADALREVQGIGGASADEVFESYAELHLRRRPTTESSKATSTPNR